MSKPSRGQLRKSLAATASLVIAIGAASAAVPTGGAALAGIERLEAARGARAVLVSDPVTRKARFLRLANRTDLADPGITPGEKAAAFFASHGQLFGVRDAGAELRLRSDRVNRLGLRTQTFQQYHRGVQVFGARLRANFDGDGRLRSINGGFLPELDLNTTPTIRPDAAAQAAMAHVSGQLERDKRAGLEATGDALYVMREGLARGIDGPAHLVFEITVSGPGLRELVYVDAHSARVVEQITGLHDALDRRVYDGGYGFPFLVWSEGDPSPFGDLDIDRLIDYTEDTYNLFASLTGGDYLGWTGSAPVMESVNNSPDVPCPNARWNGSYIEFCPGTTSDDVVAHEWGHAYTQATHGLIYQWQPGALNESYSDIFGEIVDLLNADGADSPDIVRSDGACSSFAGGSPPLEDSRRWLTGEDATSFGGAIRDLWTPTCLGDPGRVSAASYRCGTRDSGGVHTNSGVPNHGFALLVDGGNYNGRSIMGLGVTKAAHIYWRAMTAYQVPDSGFADHADALQAACVDLAELGVDLPALSTESISTGPSGEMISADDCIEVARVAAAVELRTPPVQCDFQPLFEQPAPALCDGDQAPVAHLSTDFESGLGGWTAGTRAVADPTTFDTPDWSVVGDLPFNRQGSAAFVPNPILGDCASDSEAGVLYLESPEIAVPTGADPLLLAFDHSVATEPLWDGANLKISVNGADFSIVPASAFTFNGYNDVLNVSDNPLGGEAAFTSADGGSVNTLWGQSRVDLSGLADSGDTVRLRFEMGLDGCNGQVGWYVDDVRAYSCGAENDSDLDGHPDSLDNCTNVANADQLDTDGDGIGNRCDADLDNDCQVNFQDLGRLKSVLFTAYPDADFNGDGSVNFIDLGLMKSLAFQPPGPSATGCN